MSMKKDFDVKTITVEEFTSVDPITANKHDNLAEIKKIMLEHSIRHIPVLESGKVVGVISERDISRVDDSMLVSTSAEEIMIDHPYSVYSNENLKDVVFNMSELKIGSALVNDEHGNFMGIFTSTDALNAIVEILD